MEPIVTIDKTGKVYMPTSLRDYFSIHEGDKFKIVEQKGNIVFIRHAPTCQACNDDTDVKKVNKTFLCGECRDSVIKTLVEEHEQKSGETRTKK